jgi:hypothetical protein
MFRELHSIWELRIYEGYTYFQANTVTVSYFIGCSFELQLTIIV